ICGMALEPRGVAPAEESPELADMTRRLWIAAALSAPLLLIAMLGMGGPEFLSIVRSPWLQFALATPVWTWAAWPVYERAIPSVRTRHLDMFTLIGLGVFVAYADSVVAVLAPGLFPVSFRDAHGEVAMYF